MSNAKPHFEEPRRLLGQVDAIEQRIAQLTDRRQQVVARIDELRGESEDREASRRSVRDSIKRREATVDDILKGKRSSNTGIASADLVELERDNVQIDNDVADLRRDMAALSVECDTIDESIAEAREDHRIVYASFLSALGDALVAYRDVLAEQMIHDALVPMLAVQTRARGHGVRLGKLELTLNATTLQRWGGKRFEDWWPRRSNTLHDGTSIDHRGLSAAFDALLERVGQGR